MRVIPEHEMYYVLLRYYISKISTMYLRYYVSQKYPTVIKNIFDSHPDAPLLNTTATL